MGLFTGFVPKSSASVSGASSFGGSKHVSRHELEREVRRDLHDELGEHMGEQFFNMMSQHLDKDSSGGHNANGREIRGMFHDLQENHHDNIKSHHIEKAKAIIDKHFND